MASDFQRPRSWMTSASIPAQRSAVAPPGRKLRAVSSDGSIPVRCLRSLAEWRSALVMFVGLACLRSWSGYS
jgi:hypothetical protein